MRRISIAVVLGIVAGLAAFLVWSRTGPVALLTGVDSCWAGGAQGYGGLLSADPVNGTSLRGKPVMWPIGYSARHAGSEVEVLNTVGTVVATTGRVYYFSQASVTGPNTVDTDTTYLASADCGYLWSFIDCTAVAQATGDAAPESDLGQRRSYCSQIPPE